MWRTFCDYLTCMHTCCIAEWSQILLVLDDVGQKPQYNVQNTHGSSYRLVREWHAWNKGWILSEGK